MTLTLMAVAVLSMFAIGDVAAIEPNAVPPAVGYPATAAICLVIGRVFGYIDDRDKRRHERLIRAQDSKFNHLEEKIKECDDKHKECNDKHSQCEQDHQETKMKVQSLEDLIHRIKRRGDRHHGSIDQSSTSHQPLKEDSHKEPKE